MVNAVDVALFVVTLSLEEFLGRHHKYYLQHSSSTVSYHSNLWYGKWAMLKNKLWNLTDLLAGGRWLREEESSSASSKKKKMKDSSKTEQRTTAPRTTRSGQEIHCSVSSFNKFWVVPLRILETIGSSHGIVQASSGSHHHHSCYSRIRIGFDRPTHPIIS